ncbi:MAG TPA: class I SAM-dependent methyltransferase [Acidimicrobiales bacterium]|nr:class I SAM-dependent methyltransferase [Acidimicrobiales bacterium]
MTVDHYSGAGRRWAEGAALVYGPLSELLVAGSPHALAGRTVLDVGAGTGLAGAALIVEGARPLSCDLSFDMLAHEAGRRPPAAVADVRALPFGDDSVDDVVAAFVLNHLVAPAGALAELVRVVRPGGAVLACVYANANHSPVRDLVDDTARAQGWTAPGWYTALKAEATPVLGTATAMAAAAGAAGLGDLDVEERAVDVGVVAPEQLVDYRLGQAHYSAWMASLRPREAERVRRRAVEAVAPVMVPYRPVVVFLRAVVPGDRPPR